MCETPLHRAMTSWLVLCVTVLQLYGVSGYFGDWGVLGPRPQEPTCVKIPEDMDLCTGLDYNDMRLPNLLDHGSVQEAKQQSGSWVPLLNVRCHPDTKLFLCSLFSPVCLETAIYPCRSLCTSVRDACETRMLNYGYHWPEMLNCDNFPMDNDMCIKSIHSANTPSDDGPCEVCNPVDTLENTLDNFCRAEFVFRVKFRRQRKSDMYGKKPRVYKRSNKISSKLLRRPKISLTGEASCCSLKVTSKPFLVMGISQGNTLIPTFIVPWSQFKKLKYPIKKLQELDCSDPNLFTKTVLKTNKKQKTDTDLPKKPPKKTSKNKGKKKNSPKNKKEISNNKQLINFNQNSTLYYEIPHVEADQNVETKISKSATPKHRKKQKTPKKRRRNNNNNNDKKEEKP